MAQDVFGFVGTVLEGKYRLDTAVGEGGFGVVYRGLDLSFQRHVAVKCLKIPPHFTPDAQQLLLQKFQEEGQTLSRLSEHPAIVRVFSFGTVRSRAGIDVPFLIMEWLNGSSFEDALPAWIAQNGRPLSEAQALVMLRPIVDALALCHQVGIAHRDIKPANLFLTQGLRGQQPKLLDFGIAKAMQEGETRTQLVTRTSSGFSAFSPQYGAPEQFHPKRYGPTGPWTDVHALGLVLVELVTGRPAFAGEDQAELYEASTGEARPTPQRLGLQVSPAFEALCARALARNPKERFSNASEMLDALDRASATANAGSATALPPQSRVQVETLGASGIAVSGTAPSSEPAPPTVKTRNPSPPWPLIGGIVGVVAVAAVGLGLKLSQSPPATPPRPATTASQAPSAPSAEASSPSLPAKKPVDEATKQAVQLDPPTVGEPVIVSKGKEGELLFEKGVLQALKKGKALVNDKTYGASSVWAARQPKEYPWSEGDLVVYEKTPGKGPVLAGIVRSVRLDDQLTVDALDGKEAQTIYFSPPQSLKAGHLRLADAIPVPSELSAALRAPLEAAITKGKAVAEERKRAQPAAGTPAVGAPARGKPCPPGDPLCGL